MIESRVELGCFDPRPREAAIQSLRLCELGIIHSHLRGSRKSSQRKQHASDRDGFIVV